MIEAIALTAALALPAADDRQWNVDRPSRGAYSSASRRASTIPARWRPFADCVSDRESSGSYSARNPSSSAAGRWQFLDNSWREGLAHMVRQRLVRFGLPAAQGRAVRIYLQATPIHRWPAPYQDAGFAEVVERGGWFHWTGHTCNRLAPR